MRRLSSALIAMAVLGTGFVSIPSAQAAVFSVTATGNRTVSPNTLVVSPTSVSAAVGDTFTLNFGLGGAFTFLTVINSTGAVSASGTPCTATACQIAPGSNLSLTVVSQGTLTLDMTGTVVTLTLGAGGSSSSVSTGPAPIVQQFGLPVSGTCDAAASKDLNWAGVSAGGWAISWGQWMNGGKGGAVCSRTLVYSATKAAWTVAT